jgi:hypothetical protein
MISKDFLYNYKFDNKSGKMSMEKYVSKNFFDDYTYIVKYCEDNNINHLCFKEKVYHVINDIKTDVICVNELCDNLVKFKNSSMGYYDYCSNKCIGSDDKIKKKKENTNLKKFGHKHAAHSEHAKAITSKKYENRTNSYKKSILNKRIKTLNDRYGVNNVASIDGLLERRVESFKKNIDAYKASYKKTSLDRYGVDHPWKNEKIHKKSILNSKITKNENLYKKVLDKIHTYDNIHFISIDYHTRVISLHCDVCNEEFNIHREYLHNRQSVDNVICTKCNPVSSNISGLEKDLKIYIESIYDDLIIENDRKVLGGKELDIYLPNSNIAFEFNGLYWHSEINKAKKYHYDKTNMCLSKGVYLMHIWEDDWILRKDIIKSIISYKLKKTIGSIYARKCLIKTVNIEDSRIFMDNNHIQGYSNSNIKLGLYHKDTLVSLMCFSRPRGGSDNEYELIRFCNLLKTNVVGGASKLFNYLLKQYSVSSVISFSDTSMFDGSLYEKLGFEHTKNVPIDYKWIIGNRRCHKSKYRKSQLIKMGYDIDKSEKEIMYEDVISYRIWDCGKVKWIYKTL